MVRASSVPLRTLPTYLEELSWQPFWAQHQCDSEASEELLHGFALGYLGQADEEEEGEEKFELIHMVS